MSKTEDLIYAESDGGCAHCGIRDSRVLTVHHLTQAAPKIEDYDNKIVLCHNCHQAHHAGKGPTESQLRVIKRRLIAKTLTVTGLNAMKLAYRKGEVVAIPFLLLHLVELRLLEQTQVFSSWDGIGDQNSHSLDAEVGYRLTDRGRVLLERWKLK